jgi:hypothetical protein
MWNILFIACSINSSGLCYPGTATLTASSMAECQRGGLEGLAVFQAKNPRLKVKAWTCRPPMLKGAVYE